MYMHWPHLGQYYQLGVTTVKSFIDGEAIYRCEDGEGDERLDSHVSWDTKLSEKLLSSLQAADEQD